MNIKDGTSVTRSKCNSNNRNRNCHILIEQRLYPCCLIVAANYFEFENRSVPHGCNLCPTHLFFGAHACRCILKEMTCIFIVVQSVGDYFATCYIQIGVGPVVCYVLHTCIQSLHQSHTFDMENSSGQQLFVYDMNVLTTSKVKRHDQ